MRKLIAVLLCLCLIFAGCIKEIRENPSETMKEVPTVTGVPEDDGEQKGQKEQQPHEVTEGNHEKDDNDGQNKAEVEQTGHLYPLKLNEEWSAITLTGVPMPDYSVPGFEAKVDPYVIHKDLSNIENIGQFSGFTKEQKKMLSKNGFVVLPGGRAKIFHVYDTNEYLGVPNFITTDTVLHLYHQFYDKSLMYIESDYLYDYLDHLTRQMLDKSIRLMDMLKEEDLKKLQERNIVYFLVARMLMQNTSEIQAEVSTDLLTVAKEEYRLIEAAEGFLISPYLGFDFDYSQFTVRGHYTRSEELGRFFRTMMWFGTVPLPFSDNEGKLHYENTLQALLISYTTFLDTDYICDAELWNNIYQPTKQYVGVSDDVNVFMLNGLRLDVFKDTEDPNVFNDEVYYDQLSEAVSALPEPKIQGKLITVTAPTQKQFRYMGQRYILDSFIMQELMEPILRPMPTALDSMGVLGSQYAEDLLFSYYKPQEEWPDYEAIYYDLKEAVAGYGVETWGENLYNGWLWSIKENLTEYDAASGMPFFMKNDAWRAKSLNASLGSYTELKHDTVLYGKQAAAEGGGGIDYKQADYHYVEPNVNLYSKLLYLTEYTVSVLRERNMLSESLEEGATLYQELLKLLITCSVKELRNEMLTEEEYDALLYYGAKMEGISNTFMLAMARDYEALDITDMLVTDIATNPGAYLTLGTGFFDEIYVVVPVDGKLYLSRGAVYSSYEFVSNIRLTDEQWWKMNGITIIREEYGEYPERTEPSENLPQQPDWVKNFKTDKNEVKIERIEIDWELLVD